MHLRSTADQSTQEDEFKILAATIAGSFLKLSFNQRIDADLAPSADDFSITFPAGENASPTTLRPALLELKDVAEETRSAVVLVMDEDLPHTKEIEVHYHPQQVLMWSITTDDAVEPFSATLPVKLSGTKPSAANSPKLLEAIRLKKSIDSLAEPPKAASPPEIVSIDDETIEVALNRELITHQGVSLADFRADVDGHWIELAGATAHQPANNKPHSVILKINRPLKLGSEVTIAFKAKRYPITAIDGSQISAFKTTARYIEEGKVEHLENSSQTTTMQKNPEAEEFHLRELETMTQGQTGSGWALKGIVQSVTGLFSSQSNAGASEDNQPIKSGLKYMVFGFVLVAGFLVYSLSSLFTAFTPEGESSPNFAVAASNSKSSSDNKCTLNYQSGNYYRGACSSGNTPHGWGIYEWTSGSRYEGEFEYGKRTGQGAMEYSDGSKYEGNWKGDKKDGIGTFWNPQGDRFEGKFNAGLMTNNGTCYRRNGTQARGICPS